MKFKKLYFHCSLNYAGVSMTLTLFCTPAHFIKHKVYKAGKKDVNMMMSWCYCFLRYNVFGCFSLKETEHLLNIWCKIKIYVTRLYHKKNHIYFTSDYGKSYFHDVKILLSMITCEINFYLTPTFNIFSMSSY